MGVYMKDRGGAGWGGAGATPERRRLPLLEPLAGRDPGQQAAAATAAVAL